MSRIQGKVVRIFSDTQLAINVGSQAGVTKGTRFTIHSRPTEINDIDGTGLGSVWFTKGRVIATFVSERFSIVQTETISTIQSQLFGASWPQSTQEKLIIRTTDLDAEQDPVTVMVGDIVFEVAKTEKTAQANADDAEETQEEEAEHTQEEESEA